MNDEDIETTTIMPTTTTTTTIDVRGIEEHTWNNTGLEYNIFKEGAYPYDTHKLQRHEKRIFVLWILLCIAFYVIWAR